MLAENVPHREILPELVEAMSEAGISAEFIYAYKKTGYVLLSDSAQKRLQALRKCCMRRCGNISSSNARLAAFR